MNERVIKAALLGAGTVGSGVYALAQMLKDEMVHKSGANLEIKRILVRDVRKKRDGIPAELITDNWAEILNDEEIQLVIEVMGGIEPAKTYIEQALNAGKQVVTANKDLLAEHGQELLVLAEQRGCDLHFEAAVAGAIPIIRPLKQSLTGSMLTEIMGIVNGTTNYILTRMTEDGLSYSEALSQAQRLGYAEADPTADVKGYDAGRKIAIMASLAFDSKVTFSDVYTEGITKITANDIKYARESGYVIKLVGIAKLDGGEIEVKVHPMLIPDTHPLAAVRDSFNAVFVHGEACDDAMFMGRGAGKMPTASAVMGDVIAIMRNIIHDNCGFNGGVAYKDIPIKPITESNCRYFLNLRMEDKPGAMATLAGILGDNDVNIAQMVQKRSHGGVAEIIIITDLVKEQYFSNAMAMVSKMPPLKEIASIIRVYSE